MPALTAAHLLTVQLLAAPYDPGTGKDLPGKAGTGLHTIADYTATVAIVVCVICMIGAGVMLAASAMGHGQPKVGALGWVGGGSLVVASAAAIVGGITG